MAYYAWWALDVTEELEKVTNFVKDVKIQVIVNSKHNNESPQYI